MKHLLLLLPLAACAPHIYVKENHHVQMDRADHRAFLDHNPHHGVDGDDNGAGSASSDAVSDSGDGHERNDSDDSNGDGSDD